MFLSREIGLSYAHKTEDPHFWTLKLHFNKCNYDAVDTFQQILLMKRYCNGILKISKSESGKNCPKIMLFVFLSSGS